MSRECLHVVERRPEGRDTIARGRWVGSESNSFRFIKIDTNVTNVLELSNEESPFVRIESIEELDQWSLPVSASAECELETTAGQAICEESAILQKVGIRGDIIIGIRSQHIEIVQANQFRVFCSHVVEVF